MKRISQLETIAHTKHIAATLFWPTAVIIDALGRDPTNERRVFIAVRTVRLVVLRRHATLYISSLGDALLELGKLCAPQLGSLFLVLGLPA